MKLKSNYSYDSRLDIARIEIKKKYKYEESIDIQTGVYLDFDDKYSPVSIEIIDASKRMEVSKEFLESASGDITITIEKNIINMEVIFKNKDKKSILNLNTPKENYIPNCESIFTFV